MKGLIYDIWSYEIFMLNQFNCSTFNESPNANNNNNTTSSSFIGSFESAASVGSGGDSGVQVLDRTNSVISNSGPIEENNNLNQAIVTEEAKDLSHLVKRNRV